MFSRIILRNGSLNPRTSRSTSLPTVVSIISIVEKQVADRQGSNHTIYLSDEKAFVSMAKVEYDVKNLHSRESGPCIVPAKYTKTYTKQTGQWYGSWSPASACQYGQKSTGGGSSAISYSSSISITENAGLDWTIIKDVLSASLGLTVTETWGESKTYTCTLPPKSVVQIWSQPYIAWGWFWSQTCVSNPMCGGCANERVDGGATAPAQNPGTHQFFQLGCSTGTNNVRC